MKELFGMARDKKSEKRERKAKKEKNSNNKNEYFFTFPFLYRKNYILLKIVFVKTCYNCLAVLSHGKYRYAYRYA